MLYFKIPRTKKCSIAMCYVFCGSHFHFFCMVVRMWILKQIPGCLAGVGGCMQQYQWESNLEGYWVYLFSPSHSKIAILAPRKTRTAAPVTTFQFCLYKKGICYSPALSLHHTMPRRSQRWLPDFWVSIPGFRGWLLSRVVARISREQGSWILGGRIFCLRLQCL